MDYITTFPVSILIIAITVLTSMKAFNDSNFMNQCLLYPYQMARDKSWHRFFTSGLVHADTFHLGFNMISFFSFGTLLEPVMGSLSFGLLYIMSLVISDLPSVVRHKDNPAYRALGASGSVSAVILACVLYNPDRTLMMLFIPFEIPGWLFAILYMGYSHYASRNSNSNIGHEAHLWGAISGIILGLIMSTTIREHFFAWLALKGGM